MQYFLPFAAEGINKQIEKAILRADKLGVKVLSLAALNKVGVYTVIFYFLVYFKILTLPCAIHFWWILNLVGGRINALKG